MLYAVYYSFWVAKRIKNLIKNTFGIIYLFIGFVLN